MGQTCAFAPQRLREQRCSARPGAGGWKKALRATRIGLGDQFWFGLVFSCLTQSALCLQDVRASASQLVLGPGLCRSPGGKGQGGLVLGGSPSYHLHPVLRSLGRQGEEGTQHHI